MFDFADPQVMAIIEVLHEKIRASGVAAWLMKEKDLHIIGHINGPIGRDLEHVLSSKYTIGHMVFEMNKTLVIDDTLTHPLVGKTAAVKDMGIMAYLGTPFHLNGVTIGGISAIHQHARRWEAADVAKIEAAAQVMSQLAQEKSHVISGTLVLRDPCDDGVGDTQQPVEKINQNRVDVDLI
jgi:hypothetical protein